jgi:CarD family transcriptional regulator
MPTNWNHRHKHNREKIKSGEISQIAEVVRNLTVYGGEHGLSTGERTMLMKARQILTSEIALVRDVEIAEAERIVDGALKDGAR